MAVQQAQAVQVASTLRFYEADFGIADDPAGKLAVEFFWPTAGVINPQILFCIPGGAMNRHYWNIGDSEHPRFSFARQMAARGFVCATVDAPGLGDSDKPADGHVLTPQGLADTFAELRDAVLADIHSGGIDERLAKQPNAFTIGIGHSMGCLLTILQQQRHKQHAAIAILGFGFKGLPKYVSPKHRAMLDDLEQLRAAIPEFARKMFPAPWPLIPPSPESSSFYGKAKSDPDGVEAIKKARDFLLPQPGYMGMLPGNVAPEAAEIDVPVYLAIGERDIIAEPETVAEGFRSSPEVQYQSLPDTGHSHFLFESRDSLFEGIAAWAAEIP